MKQELDFRSTEVEALIFALPELVELIRLASTASVHGTIHVASVERAAELAAKLGPVVAKAALVTSSIHNPVVRLHVGAE